jgi:hypothetical protein
MYDLAIVGENWLKTSQTWDTGDFTGEGNVDLFDFAIMGAHWLENANP